MYKCVTPVVWCREWDVIFLFWPDACFHGLHIEGKKPSHLIPVCILFDRQFTGWWQILSVVGVCPCPLPPLPSLLPRYHMPPWRCMLVAPPWRGSQGRKQEIAANTVPSLPPLPSGNLNNVLIRNWPRENTILGFIPFWWNVGSIDSVGL